MGNEGSSFVPVPAEDMTILRESTRFSQGQIEYLYVRFREIGEPRKRTRYLLKMDFYTSNRTLHTLIINEMFGEKNRIDFVEFATFLHIFHPIGQYATPNEYETMKYKKLKLLFNMYDMDKDGDISKEDLLNIVYRLFADYSNFQTMCSMVDVMMKEMCRSSIGSDQILFEDFCRAMKPFDMDHLAVKFPEI